MQNRLPKLFRHRGKGSAAELPLVLFDDTHGQSHWNQTGFSSRELHTNFRLLAETATEFLAARCHSTNHKPLANQLAGASLLVLPTPAGKYDRTHRRWRRTPESILRPDEISAILSFIHQGGSLLAFAYRFGDSFTDTNLKDLFSPLGCHLNADAVLDLDQLRSQHPLKSQFQTTRHLLPVPWCHDGVDWVVWRTMATFTILPGGSAKPLALSPGGRCISFDRTLREIAFDSLPLAVLGNYGAGRYRFLCLVQTERRIFASVLEASFSEKANEPVSPVYFSLDLAAVIGSNSPTFVGLSISAACVRSCSCEAISFSHVTKCHRQI